MPQKKVEKKVAIGIDLGTTKCCVGAVRDGKVEILENEQARKTTPSYVAFTDIERLVGEDAKNQATLNPANTVFAVKEILGKDLEDSQIRKSTEDMPYIIVDNAGDPCINVTYKGEEEVLLPQQVTAMLLTKMKDLAQTRLRCPVEEAVISVPASFTNAQRQATKDAAAIAGLKVLALINEPTAAAIAYQVNRKEEAEENIAVVDFGGGKLDVAIVAVSSGFVAVRGLSGTTDLGGNDVDEILMNYVQEKLKKKYSGHVPFRDAVKERLRAACVKLKHSLSLLPKVQDQLDCFGDDFVLPICIKKDEFSAMIGNEISPCLGTHLAGAVQVSGLDKQTISRVVLVGGSTRIPLVPEEIHRFFGVEKLDRSVNPDEAVAQGAAIYAALLSGDNTVPELTVKDMLPNSFALVNKGGSDLQKIFCNYGMIPYRKNWSVNETTRCQTFELYEELAGRRNPHRLIGSLCLSDEFNKAVHLITYVVFEINPCGILDVRIQLGPCKDESYIIRDVVRNYSGRLSSERLKQATERELSFRQDEKEEKDRVEALTDLESCCFRLQSEMQVAKGRQLFLDLVEQIEAEARSAIDWLDTEGHVSKSDCQSKLKGLKNLERKLQEELRRLEKLEKDRADAEKDLRSYCSSVETFLVNTDVSEEPEIANKVKEQLELLGKWLQSETLPSKSDCNGNKVVLLNELKVLGEALEMRKRERERQASVCDLRSYCSELQAVKERVLEEADLPLVNEICDQARDTLQWLEDHTSASKEKCDGHKKSLFDKMAMLQNRTEKRERARAAELEKERAKAATILWDRCQELCAKMQSSTIEIHDVELSRYIYERTDTVAKPGKVVSKAECDEALKLVINLEGLFSEWVRDRQEKELQQNQEKEQAEAAKKREKELAEADKKREKKQADAAKEREKERADATKKQENQRADATKKQENQRADADKKREKKQADAARETEKEQADATKKQDKERTDALQRFESKWESLESTLALNVLQKENPALVLLTSNSAESTRNWLKTTDSFCPEQYKKRLEDMRILGEELQERDQQLRANDPVDARRDSDTVMVDMECESKTEKDRSSCSLM